MLFSMLLDFTLPGREALTKAWKALPAMETFEESTAEAKPSTQSRRRLYYNSGLGGTTPDRKKRKHQDTGLDSWDLLLSLSMQVRQSRLNAMKPAELAAQQEAASKAREVERKEKNAEEDSSRQRVSSWLAQEASDVVSSSDGAPCCGTASCDISTIMHTCNL